MNTTLSTPKLALRLWQSHLIMIVFGFIAFASNDFIQTNRIITALATVFFLLIYLILCYNESNHCAKNDVVQKRDGGTAKGIKAGLLASVPGIFILLLDSVVPFPSFLQSFDTLPHSWYRIYMIVYEGLLSFTGSSLPMKLLILIPLPACSIIGYCTGRKNKNLMAQLEQKFNRLIYEKKQ